MGFIQNLDEFAPGIVNLIAKINPESVYGRYIESTGSEAPQYYSETYGYIDANNVGKITKDDRDKLKDKQIEYLKDLNERKKKQREIEERLNEERRIEAEKAEAIILAKWKQEQEEKAKTPLYKLTEQLKQQNKFYGKTDREIAQYIFTNITDYFLMYNLMAIDDNVLKNLKNIMPSYDDKMAIEWLEHACNTMLRKQLESEYHFTLQINEVEQTTTERSSVMGLFDLFGRDVGSFHESTGSEASEYYGGRDSAWANENLLSYSSGNKVVNSGIKYFELYKMKNISQEVINLTSPYYKLEHLLKDLKKLDEYSFLSDKELVKKIYDEMSAYEQVKKILSVDGTLEDKIKTIMPTYNSEIKTILENIQKNQSIMSEIDKMIPLDKKLSNLTSGKKENQHIDTREEELIS